MNIKLCFITLKNRFYLDDDILISSNFLWYEDDKILGFEFREFKKIIFIGFKSTEKFDGYIYSTGAKSGISVIGPSFKGERRYILDRLINIFLTLKEVWKNRRILKDVDLVFAPFFEYVFFEFLLLRFIARKAKFILYVIGDYPELNYRKKKNLFYKMFLLSALNFSIRLSSEAWFISEYLLRKYGTRKSVMVRSSRIKDADILTTHIKRFSAPYTLVYVGRITEDKNPMLLPLILYEVINHKKLDVRLRIIGDGPLRGRLIESFQRLNLIEFVDFHGWVKDKESLLSILDESHILVLTSISEGTPLVFFESFARGLVVVSTNFPGAEEVVKEHINGYLIDCDKSNDTVAVKFAQKIEFLITNPEIYEQISRNNIERAKEWTIEKITREYRKRIERLLNINTNT